MTDSLSDAQVLLTEAYTHAEASMASLRQAHVGVIDIKVRVNSAFNMGIQTGYTVNAVNGVARVEPLVKQAIAAMEDVRVALGKATGAIS